MCPSGQGKKGGHLGKDIYIDMFNYTLEVMTYCYLIKTGPVMQSRGRGAIPRSQHPSMMAIRSHIPGTSTLSLPGVHSSFPGTFDPSTKSYSLDLVEMQIENYPNSRGFFKSYCNMAIKSVIDGILRSHGYTENSQAVRDFHARCAGVAPSPVMPQYDDIAQGLSEEEVDQLIEETTKDYQECIKGEAYYARKAKELGNDLQRLGEKKRQMVISKTTGFIGSIFQPLPLGHSQAAQPINVPQQLPVQQVQYPPVNITQEQVQEEPGEGEYCSSPRGVLCRWE